MMLYLGIVRSSGILRVYKFRFTTVACFISSLHRLLSTPLITRIINVSIISTPTICILFSIAMSEQAASDSSKKDKKPSPSKGSGAGGKKGPKVRM